MSQVLPSIHSVPIVKEFLQVFRDDMTEVYLEREIDFVIDIILDTCPILILPCRMASVELKEW